MLLQTIKNKYKSWSDRRFLKKHGCDNWNQFHYRNDPDVNYRATEVKQYYHGYPYVYRFERTHQIYDWDICYSGWDIVESQVKINCQGKFRFDALRVMPQNGIGIDGKVETVWFINEMGGGDYIYVAFKEPKDYTMFLLKWT